VGKKREKGKRKLLKELGKKKKNKKKKQT